MAAREIKNEKMITKSAAETQRLASELAKKIRPGDIICLYGNLGSGKTTFTQGLAKTLGIKETVNSPSFVLEKQYAAPNKTKIIHYDFYRLGDWREAKYIGFKDTLKDNKNLIIIEWPERVEKLLSLSRWNLFFKYLGGNKREIKIIFPRKPIRAVIFDLDETLVKYFYTTGVSSHQKAARRLGLKIPNSEEIRKNWGLPWKKFIHVLWPEANIEKFRSDYLSHKDYVAPLLPGAKKILKFLKSKKIILGLITSRDHDLTMGQIKNIDVKKYFDFIMSCDETKFDKPDPRVFNEPLKILGKHGILKNEIIYVGDSLRTDFPAARGAGIKFLALTTGLFSKKDFLTAGVKKENIFSNLYELQKYFNN